MEIRAIDCEALQLKRVHMKDGHTLRVYRDTDPKKNYGPITVPEDQYFILGDNRPGSNDSRFYLHPTVRKEAIYSKVTEIYHDYYAKSD